MATFLPKMQSSIEGIDVIGEVSWRAWNGVIADVWNVNCSENARGEYISADPRLVVVLDRAGRGGIHVRTSAAPAARDRASIRHPMNYIPAGMRLWSEVEEIKGLQHLDVHFDVPTLRARFKDHVDIDMVEMPRLMFSDDRLMGLAKLIAAECLHPTPGNDLYCDSLVAALVGALWPVEPRARRRRGQLSRRQLQQIIDYIEEHCARSIRVQELADLAGLTESYVGRAFIATTGMPIHAWQMRARVEKVKALLSKPELTLTTAAHVAGFADQAHLTRVFRRVVGTTPAAWQRTRGN